MLKDCQDKRSARTCIRPSVTLPEPRPGALALRAVPGHDQYVLYPYEQDYPTSAERCRKMGERCDVRVEVKLDGASKTQAFWIFFKKHMGGLPGQKDSWRGATQWTSPMNSSGDRIGIYVGNKDLLWLYIRAGEAQGSNKRAARMRQYSWMMREQMGDQELGENLEKNSEDGTTVTVQRPRARDDEDEWPEAARWIIEQHERLRAILAGPPLEEGDRNRSER